MNIFKYIINKKKNEKTINNYNDLLNKLGIDAIKMVHTATTNQIKYRGLIINIAPTHTFEVDEIDKAIVERSGHKMDLPKVVPISFERKEQNMKLPKDEVLSDAEKLIKITDEATIKNSQKQNANYNELLNKI